jgi:hypothetical protein
MFSLPASTPVRKSFAIFFRVPLWPEETIQNFFCVETPYSAKLCFNFFIGQQDMKWRSKESSTNARRSFVSHLSNNFSLTKLFTKRHVHIHSLQRHFFSKQRNLITNTFTYVFKAQHDLTQLLFHTQKNTNFHTQAHFYKKQPTTFF